MSIADLAQNYVPKDTFLAIAAVFGVPGVLFMIALGVSILRIHFAIKRDGKEPPGLGVFALMDFSHAFMTSERRFKKKIQYQAEHGVDLISISYALIYPYVKLKDR